MINFPFLTVQALLPFIFVLCDLIVRWSVWSNFYFSITIALLNIFLFKNLGKRLCLLCDKTERVMSLDDRLKPKFSCGICKP